MECSRATNAETNPGRVAGMLRRTFTGALALGAAASIRPATAQTQAQAWPTKPLHIVIPYPPGGPSDVSTPHRHGTRRPDPRPERAVRQQGRRLGHDRRGVREEPAGRHPHVPHHHDGDGLHHPPPAADPVRAGKGLHSGVAHDDLMGRLCRASLGAGQDGCGVRGLCQGQPGQDQLRLGRPRHHHPPVRRDAQSGSRHPDGARALSRQCAGDQRAAGRRSPGPVRPDDAAAHQGGQAARPRHAGRGAPSRFSRHSDAARDRATARKAAIPGSACSRPPAHRWPSWPGSTRQSPQPFARPTSWRRSTTAACA